MAFLCFCQFLWNWIFLRRWQTKKNEILATSICTCSKYTMEKWKMLPRSWHHFTQPKKRQMNDMFRHLAFDIWHPMWIKILNAFNRLLTYTLCNFLLSKKRHDIHMWMKQIKSSNEFNLSAMREFLICIQCELQSVSCRFMTDCYMKWRGFVYRKWIFMVEHWAFNDD